MKPSVIQNFNLSVRLYSAGNFHQAVSELVRLNHWSDSLKGYWAILAFCYQKINEKALSKAAFLKAIEGDKLNFELYAQFANLLVSLKEYGDAEKNYLYAIRLNPNNYVFHYNLGLFYFNRGFYLKAADSLKSSLAINPEHEKSFYLLAQSQALSGNYEHYLEAKKSLFSLLEKDLMNRKALRLWADILWLKKDSDWKLFYEKLCNEGLINIDILGDFISKLINAGMSEYAENMLVNVSHSVPSLNVSFLRSYVSYNLGDYDCALGWINTLPTNYLNVDICRRLMIYIQLALSHPREALEVSEKLISTSSDPLPEDVALLAICYKKTGKWSAYRELYDFDKMIKVLPIPTPEGFSSVEAFNKALEHNLLELHQDKNYPLEQSLRNGSQTIGHLFEMYSDNVSKLEKAISLCVADFINSMPDNNKNLFFSKKSPIFRYTGAWSVKLSNTGFHRNHFHNDGWISGCYYINVPDAVNEQGQGWIKFGEMESVSDQKNDADFYIKPIAGCVVLFPSYMWHGTVPFLSEQNRLTVAFDLIPD